MESSLDLKYNMGVAFGTFAGVLKKSDTRNAKEQVRGGDFIGNEFQFKNSGVMKFTTQHDLYWYC